MRKDTRTVFVSVGEIDQVKSGVDGSCSAVEAVLFDYGMVLSGPPDPEAWRRMLEITTLEQAAFEHAYWMPRHEYDRGTHTGAEYWQAVGHSAGLHLSDAQVAELLDADVELWTQVNQPMVDWAFRLQATGTRTGILSNLGDAMSAGILRKFTWLANFNFLLWSHSLKLAKPEIAIYAHAAEGLNTPPSRILFVDDRAENIDGALAAGMQAIPYTEQRRFEQELEARGLEGLWRRGRSDTQ